MPIILHLTLTFIMQTMEEIPIPKKILNHILRFMQTNKIYFSVSSFKKDSSLNCVSNKDHVKSKKKSMKRTSSHSDSTNIERTTTR